MKTFLYLMSFSFYFLSYSMEPFSVHETESERPSILPSKQQALIMSLHAYDDIAAEIAQVIDSWAKERLVAFKKESGNCMPAMDLLLFHTNSSAHYKKIIEKAVTSVLGYSIEQLHARIMLEEMDGKITPPADSDTGPIIALIDMIGQIRYKALLTLIENYDSRNRVAIVALFNDLQGMEDLRQRALSRMEQQWSNFTDVLISGEEPTMLQQEDKREKENAGIQDYKAKEETGSDLIAAAKREQEDSAREAHYREAALKTKSKDFAEVERARRFTEFLLLIDKYPYNREALILKYGAYMADDGPYDEETIEVIKFADFMFQRVLHKSFSEICTEALEGYLDGDVTSDSGYLEDGNNNNVPSLSPGIEQNRAQPVITRRNNAVESAFMGANARNVAWIAGGTAAAGVAGYALYRYLKHKEKEQQAQLALQKEIKIQDDKPVELTVPTINSQQQIKVRVAIDWELANTIMLFASFEVAEKRNTFTSICQALQLAKEVDQALALEAVNQILAIAPHHKDKLTQAFYQKIIKQCESFRAQYEK